MNGKIFGILMVASLWGCSSSDVKVIESQSCSEDEWSLKRMNPDAYAEDSSLVLLAEQMNSSMPDTTDIDVCIEWKNQLLPQVVEHFQKVWHTNLSEREQVLTVLDSMRSLLVDHYYSGYSFSSCSYVMNRIEEFTSLYEADYLRKSCGDVLLQEWMDWQDLQGVLSEFCCNRIYLGNGSGASAECSMLLGDLKRFKTSVYRSLNTQESMLPISIHHFHLDEVLKDSLDKKYAELEEFYRDGTEGSIDCYVQFYEEANALLPVVKSNLGRWLDSFKKLLVELNVPDVDEYTQRVVERMERTVNF